MDQVAGNVRPMGKGLQIHQNSAQQCGLQGVYDLSQLCSPDTGDDLYHQQDRTPQPGLPQGDTHEDCDA